MQGILGKMFKMKRYAELIGNYKKQRIKSLYDNKLINDPAALLLGAVDPETGTIYFYREYYQRGQVLTQVAKAYNEMVKDIPKGYLKVPLIDPSANKRSKVTGRSYKSQMGVEFDIHFKDANNHIIDGIAKTQNMFIHNKIKIFKSLKETLNEGCEYRYPTQEERSKNKNLGDLPLDKNNHLMDCLRYICQDIPYTYTSMYANSYQEYFEFFSKSDKIKGEPNSFNKLVEILRKDYHDVYSDIKKKRRHAGGFNI